MSFLWNFVKAIPSQRGIFIQLAWQQFHHSKVRSKKASNKEIAMNIFTPKKQGLPFTFTKKPTNQSYIFSGMGGIPSLKFNIDTKHGHVWKVKYL